MVRLSDLSDGERSHILSKELPVYEEQPWAHCPPLDRCNVALLTSAGLHHVDDRAFSIVDLGYRVIPAHVDLAELTMTHSSVNFDRVGFQEDVNTVFPLDRLRELVDAGVVGSVANHHYSLMGAAWTPEMIEPTCIELARLLLADGVDAVCLVPV